MSPADVVIAGGGAIGLSIAWRASQLGLAVTLADPHPGRGASWAAAGMLAPVTELHYGEEALLALNLESSALYGDFAAELNEASGQDCGYERCGTLTVARDADDNAALTDLFEFQQKLGLEVERLRGRECKELEPGLAPSTRGGILVPGDHQVDNRALLGALAAACERAGVNVVRSNVAVVEISGETLRAVRFGDGERLGCGALVLATGAQPEAIAGLPPHSAPPVRPVKGQLLHLRGAAGQRLATHTIRGLDAYVVSRADGRAVVGATVEELGFDRRVTAGAVHELLRRGFELLPGMTEMELVETTVGLRPGTPDNAPMLGATAVGGLIVATGHYRNGILLTPVTAASIAELLATDATPAIIEPFSPRRFAGDNTIATGAEGASR